MKKEWETEPNEVKFEHSGFKCYILRHPLWSHLCGYIGLLPSHPYYGRKNVKSLSLVVHGGINFGEFGKGNKGFEEGYYWLGFDCNHSSDYSPGFWNLTPNKKPMPKLGSLDEINYRNIQFVTLQLMGLANQLVPTNLAVKKLQGED